MDAFLMGKKINLEPKLAGKKTGPHSSLGVIPAEVCLIEAQRTKVRHTFPQSQPFPDRCSLPLVQGPRGPDGGHPPNFHKLKEPRVWKATAGALVVPGAQHPKVTQ